MAAKNNRGNEMEEDENESPFFPFLSPGWSSYFILFHLSFVLKNSVDDEDGDIGGEEKRPGEITLSDGAPNTNSKRN